VAAQNYYNNSLCLRVESAATRILCQMARTQDVEALRRSALLRAEMVGKAMLPPTAAVREGPTDAALLLARRQSSLDALRLHGVRLLEFALQPCSPQFVHR